jgi:hypothetical protein
VVILLLVALCWVAVLVPPAVRARAARNEAFLDSFDEGRAVRRPSSTRSAPVQRRRRIAGGLLAAMVTTLVVGLLPTFRVFLIVHLFLVDSFLAYIALLARAANRAARAPVAVRVDPSPAVARRRRPPHVSPRPAALRGPLALN